MCVPALNLYFACSPQMLSWCCAVSSKACCPSLFSVQGFASEDEYLEIPAISRHKAGTYECTAANDVSLDVQTLDIIVNCK